MPAADDDALELADGTRLPPELLRFSATSGGGPGGQHVNRTATRVELRVRIGDLPLPEDDRARIRRRLAGRIGADDDLRVVASERRSQTQNRRAAVRRLVALLDAALQVRPARHTTRVGRALLASRRRERERDQQRRRDRRWSPGAE